MPNLPPREKTHSMPCLRRRAAMGWMGAAGAACVLPAARAQTQAFPSGPMRLVVPYAPGGTGDIVGRVLAKALSERYSNTVLVENRPGAGGHIGAAAVARSAPDGHTLLFGAIGTRAAFSATPGLRYDPVTELRPVILLADSPHVLVVSASSPARSVSDFIALARSKTGGLTFGSAGVGTSTHLVGELFRMQSGIELRHIPFKGSAPAMTDLIGGHISAMFENLPAAVSFIRSGQVRALGVTGPKRNDSIPEVPTVAEAALSGFSATSWFTIDVASGVPDTIVGRLNQDIGRVLNSAELAPGWKDLGLNVLGGSVETAVEFLKSETRKWSQLIRSAGISV
jgi:tripartite-type tricarboxylate transporter receptor subunit TctC